MYYTQKSRSSVLVTAQFENQEAIPHGVTAWFQESAGVERVKVIWNAQRKEFLSEADFANDRKARAEANREAHKHSRFGRRSHTARRAAAGFVRPSLGFSPA